MKSGDSSHRVCQLFELSDDRLAFVKARGTRLNILYSTLANRGLEQHMDAAYGSRHNRGFQCEET